MGTDIQMLLELRNLKEMKADKYTNVTIVRMLLGRTKGSFIALLVTLLSYDVR